MAWAAMRMSSSMVAATVPEAAVGEEEDPRDPLVLHPAGVVGEWWGVVCGAGEAHAGPLQCGEVLEVVCPQHSSVVAQQQEWAEADLVVDMGEAEVLLI